MERVRIYLEERDEAAEGCGGRQRSVTFRAGIIHGLQAVYGWALME
jgi:hypothetical protein